MLISCPNCRTSYDVDASKLGAEGRPVRCARCRIQWFAAAPMLVDVVNVPAAPLRLIAPPEPIPDLSWMDAPNGEAAAWDSHVMPPGDPPALADAPPLAPTIEELPIEPEAQPDRAGNAPSEDIETAARRSPLARQAHARRSRWRPPLPVVILALAGIAAALIGWRAEVVRFAPQTAQLYGIIGLPVNLRGLVFDNLKLSGETQEGMPMLVVEGSIVNVANRTVEVPRLRFALRNSSGVEVYAWTSLPSSPVAAAGEVLSFRSRLASPPGDTRDVVVRFFHRRDIESAR